MAELTNFYKSSDNPKTHIIFVHGLNGHLEDTWKVPVADGDLGLWPTWLGEDLDGSSIWSVGYEAKKFGDGSMHLKQRGGNVFELLLTYPELQFGEIILVGHSFGGLVIKQLLRHANDQLSERIEVTSFLERLTKVVFLGTPHIGSSLATLGGKFNALIRSSGVLQSLHKDDPHLVELKSWYKKWSNEHGILNLALMEDRPTTFGRGLFKTSFWIVRPESADPGVKEDAIMVDADHYNICKPQARESEVYRHVLGFIQKKNTLKQVISNGQITASQLREASAPMFCWNKTIENKFISRHELEELKTLVDSRDSGCYLLTGGAGSGKSSLLSKFYEYLSQRDLTVLAIKADELNKDINDVSDLSEHLKLGSDLSRGLLDISSTKPLVLLIDQMDAVSEVMDQSSNRFRVLVDLILTLKEQFELRKTHPIHIFMSSRPFEASFDTRFIQLDATKIELTLPSKDKIEEFLPEIGICASSVPTSMYPALQTPFALSLYVSLVKSGENPADITSKNLLSRWLEKKLPNGSSNKSYLEFLRLLASDMVDNEVLRRPVEAYLPDYSRQVNVLESIGVIVRYGVTIGFSHQTWLDDFQSQRFRSSEDIYQFILDKQNGLFSRSTILRGLEYLREFDNSEYQSALDSLLFDPQTSINIRRHIQHLLIDIISSTPSPTYIDSERVESIIKNDQVLAQRLVSKISTNWVNWRGLVVEYIPDLMKHEKHLNQAHQWLIAESKYDEENVISLIVRIWGNQEHDEWSLAVLSRGVAHTTLALNAIKSILTRTQFEQHQLSNYISQLIKINKTDSALKLLDIWLNSVPVEVALNYRFYGIDALVEQHSLELAEILMPWLIRVLESEESTRLLARVYRRSSILSDKLEGNLDKEILIGMLQAALVVSAKNSHRKCIDFIHKFDESQFDEIQSIIGTALASNAEALSDEIAQFLLSNESRLCIGSGYFQGEDNVNFSVDGNITMMLIEESVNYWSPKQISKIQEAIEKYTLYPASLELPVNRRRYTFSYSEQYRLTLLARLPSEALSPIRRRQVQERDCSREPKIGERTKGMGMASIVQSPMSEEQMCLATDNEILSFFEHFTSEQYKEKRRFSMRFGGTTELSRAFGRFASSNPERAHSLMEKHFTSEIYERAAGCAVEELSKSNVFSPLKLKGLIRKFNHRGYKSTEWVNSLGRAFQEIAKKENGLNDDDICLLVSFLTEDKHQAYSEEEFYETKNFSGAILFGNNGGSRIIPSGNYTILSAIYLGLLTRSEPDREQWIDILTQFLEISKDIETWECILLFEGRQMYWANNEKTNTLIDRLLTEIPTLFSREALVRSIWELLDRLASSLVLRIVDYWLSLGKPGCNQACGELIAGIIISGRLHEYEQLKSRWEEALNSQDPHFKTGALYAVSIGWYENGEVRGAAHKVLLECLKDNILDLSNPLNALFSYNKRMPSDELTYEFLSVIHRSPNLVATLDKSRMIGSLAKINPTYKVMRLVLAIAQEIVKIHQESESNSSFVAHADKLVELAITLQRTTGTVKEGAMTLYESLLDAGSYRAEQAADQALRGA